MVYSATEKNNDIDHDSPGGSMGVVDDVIINRSLRSSKYANNPYYIGSSPLSSRDRSKMKTDHLQMKNKDMRNGEKHQKLMKNRGGSEKMEQFVMNSERDRELKQMNELANDNAIPDNMIDCLEEEYLNDKEDRTVIDENTQGGHNKTQIHDSYDLGDSDDDDELIKYFQDKEKYEAELEQLLGELSIT